MSEEERRRKRWNREHRKKVKTPDGGEFQLVYRPKTEAERQRRADRANALVGTPFVSLPGVTDHKATLFTTKDGTPVPAEAVEMVFNDCLLMDAISNWGEDGPLYRDTLDTEVMREVYEYGLKAYAGVEIPPQLRNSRPTQ
jgi:hypothetical protein